MNAMLMSKIIGLANGPSGNKYDAKQLTELLDMWNAYFRQRNVPDALQPQHFDRIMLDRQNRLFGNGQISLTPPSH